MEKLCTSLEPTKLERVCYCGEDWDYKLALEQQLLVFDQVESGLIDFGIVSGVHSPVYTLGNSIKAKPSSESPIPFVNTDRGGRLMYHGPGQITVYPIFKLKDKFSGPREYSKFIFDTVIEYFKREHVLNVKCQQNGLWLEDKKVGFLGLRIKNGITYHGLSLNYFADLNAFKKHSPCDISGDQAGNIFECLESPGISLELEANRVSRAIAQKLTI